MLLLNKKLSPLALRTLRTPPSCLHHTHSAHTSPAILIFRLASRSKFSAFKSRWTIFRQWQKYTAVTICLNFRRASFSAILPWATRWSVVNKRESVPTQDDVIDPRSPGSLGDKWSTHLITEWTEGLERLQWLRAVVALAEAQVQFPAHPWWL